MTTRIFTIGFTKKSAAQFFSKLKAAGVRKMVDVRLNNNSQLAGFSKRDDLRFFLGEICDIGYEHALLLAPTDDILRVYKKQKGSWEEYERKFIALMEQRRIADKLAPADLDGGCLLCSEDKPHHCHRRLVAEYLKRHWGDVEITHLV